MSLQCHLPPNSVIQQGIKDQVQYKVTEMQENVVEMGYVIHKVLEFSSPLSTSERLDWF